MNEKINSLREYDRPLLQISLSRFSLLLTCNIPSGDKCDQCEPTYYGYGMEGCATCGCSSTGSTSMQCDAYGQCPCKPGIGGIQCDRYVMFGSVVCDIDSLVCDIDSVVCDINSLLCMKLIWQSNYTLLFWSTKSPLMEM